MIFSIINGYRLMIGDAAPLPQAVPRPPRHNPPRRGQPAPPGRAPLPPRRGLPRSCPLSEPPGHPPCASHASRATCHFQARQVPRRPRCPQKPHHAADYEGPSGPSRTAALPRSASAAAGSGIAHAIVLGVGRVGRGHTTTLKINHQRKIKTKRCVLWHRVCYARQFPNGTHFTFSAATN